jgi:hypothetical protein
LKQWIKKNRTLAETFDSLEDFLRVGLTTLKDKVTGHFSKCGLRASEGQEVDEDLDEDYML